jgi:transcriptional regulator of acetoin/glycerol metabolism
VTNETLEDVVASSRATRAVPGVIVVFTAGRATSLLFPLQGRALVLGRDCPAGASIVDPRISRRHVEVLHDAGGFVVRDLGSRNGTSVDGRLAREPVKCPHPPVVRFGRTVALVVRDVAPFAEGRPVDLANFVVGPTLRAALEAIAAVAEKQRDLLVLGESGTGKEMAARHFHRAGSHAAGPFVPVNCAAIPSGIAERLLFGTVKGAYSGASADARGYFRSAEGGVLFLDEFGELDLEVQAKLLRVIETKEALPVGASRAQPVNASLCLATNRDLRIAISENRFRSDLYYRIIQSQVTLPSLRERREDIPWLVQRAAQDEAPGLEIDAEVVEACMLRGWPGNVRELLAEVRRVAGVARSTGAPLRAKLLGADVGRAIERVEQAPEPPRVPVTAEAVEQALRESPNVAAAARSLRIHRSHLHRLIRQFGIDRRAAPSSKR